MNRKFRDTQKRRRGRRVDMKKGVKRKRKENKWK